MSDETKKEHEETNDASIYYVLGGVVLVAAIAGFFLLKPKTQAPATTGTPVVQTPVSNPTPAPITKLACEKQYYNPVIGFPKYYLSLEGVDKVTTGTVKCDYAFKVKDKTVATTETTAELVQVPERGGSTFRCQTNSVELARGVATSVVVTVTNPNSEKVDCTQQFIFP